MSAKSDALRDYRANLERFIREWKVLYLFESTKYYGQRTGTQDRVH